VVLYTDKQLLLEMVRWAEQLGFKALLDGDSCDEGTAWPATVLYYGCDEIPNS